MTVDVQSVAAGAALLATFAAAVWFVIALSLKPISVRLDTLERLWQQHRDDDAKVHSELRDVARRRDESGGFPRSPGG